ncbi:hypothetical protein [Jiella sonneratiae]|uniref:Uncharacterized protein n=1 Tax=Jiella sonneratiae TaxID=2816856 RepID=A0ABS3JAA1_9HYPH|nr:hypothetical protein [Jiella sonneratiae]MBO0905486.1 hypothetical protein [Jiella sonneratiae]
MNRLSAIVLTLGAASAALASQPAGAADVMESYRTETIPAKVPACDDPAVLGEVEDQFEYGAPRMLEAELSILEFRGMFEKAYQPQLLDDPYPAPNPIERRYCQAKALISDQKWRTVYYVVEYPMGYAAAGDYLGLFSPVKAWKAEGCVLGLDEWHVYGANCQSLRRYPPDAATGSYPGYVSKY